MTCAGGTELLHTDDGTRQPVAVPGTPRAIGRWWIESDGPPRTYTNRHRDEQRTGPPERDLDDPSLGKVDPPYRIREGRLLVRRGAGWRAVARCHVACRDVLVWRRRAAFLDGRELVEHRPRHTTRWRVPSGVTLHRAGDTLVLQRGGEVWRADRG
jgi:hypothetical protein